MGAERKAVRLKIYYSETLLEWSITRTFYYPPVCGNQFQLPAGNAGIAENKKN